MLWLIKSANGLKLHNMKKINSLLLCILFLIVLPNNGAGQQNANRNLSNLLSPTSVNQDLLPNA